MGPKVLVRETIQILPKFIPSKSKMTFKDLSRSDRIG